MNKTVLIAGKDAPAGAAFTAAALETGRNALITVAVETPDDQAAQGSRRIVWNRPSPVSARTLIAYSENSYGKLDEAVLIFDAQHFSPRFTVCDPACFTRAADEMMLGYFYLACEITQRYAKRMEPFFLTFLVRTSSPDEEAPALPVLTAQDTFISFASRMADQYLRESSLHITLVRGEGGNDAETAAWLFSYLDTASKKKSVSWLRPGSKGPGVFSFLR